MIKKRVFIVAIIMILCLAMTGTALAATQEKTITIPSGGAHQFADPMEKTNSVDGGVRRGTSNSPGHNVTTRLHSDKNIIVTSERKLPSDGSSGTFTWTSAKVTNTFYTMAAYTDFFQVANFTITFYWDVNNNTP